MNLDSVFQFVHVRPPLKETETKERKKKKILSNNNESALIKNAEMKTKQQGIPFEKSRLLAAKEFYYSEEFQKLISSLEDEDIKYSELKELLQNDRSVGNDELLENLRQTLTGGNQNDTSPLLSSNQQFYVSIYNNLWDSFYTMKLMEGKFSLSSLKKISFWIKIYHLLFFEKNKKKVANLIEHFEEYRPILNILFYTHPMLKQAIKKEELRQKDPLKERKEKLKALKENLNGLTQVRSRLDAITKGKIDKIIAPITPELKMDVDNSTVLNQEEWDKFQKETEAYQKQLRTSKTITSTDFSKIEKELIKQNQLLSGNKTKTELHNELTDKIATLMGEIGRLSLVESFELKNGRFVKTIKNIEV
ncbi:hypothetical protein [Aquimarina megaterium]|uniref:hypothetical protein n=1 Tax=Aquimarina megaterium TaxID=1443666 RepID=UPI0004700FB2|nr:hypothetical protein [Aquimarina megaterium]